MSESHIFDPTSANDGNKLINSLKKLSIQPNKIDPIDHIYIRQTTFSQIEKEKINDIATKFQDPPKNITNSNSNSYNLMFSSKFVKGLWG